MTSESGLAGGIQAPDDLKQERSLSRRIVVLLVIASLLLIGQSLFNLSNLRLVDESIVTVHQTAGDLEELARDIAMPVADIRMLSMETVLSPDQARLEETTARLSQRIQELEATLADWQARHENSATSLPGRDEFDAIQAAWAEYREAVAATGYYVGERIRVAAFISVTQEEKVQFELLQQRLTEYGQTLLRRSQSVYDVAQNNSRIALYTLVLTGFFQILILILILYFVYRMFRSYLRTAQQHEQELFELIDAAPLGFVVSRALETQRVVIEYVNQQFADLLGWAREDLPDFDTWYSKSYPDPAYRASVVALFQKHAAKSESASAQVEPFETDVRCKDGRILTVEWRITPIGDRSIIMAVDVTERQRMAEQILDAKEAAVAANQAKSAFLANMSHELRTPMNAILGYSEMLREEAEDAGQDDFIPDLQKINQAGNHLLALINDVLDLSKIESGKMDTYAQEFDVTTWLDEVCDTARPLFANNNNQFAVDRQGELGKAWQDDTKLRQALLNTLSNAAKFTENGSVTLRAERQQSSEGDWLQFSVADTGIGIAPEKLEHIFEEFSQADDSTTRDFGGTGLGLTISRRFSIMLGGELTVTSQLGEGSTFTVRVPATLPGTDLSPAPVVPASQATGATADHPAHTDSGQTILVIDDDPESCEIIRRSLVKDGFDVVTAATGTDGLRLAHQLRPAAITLDVLMPEMDGWSVLRALKVDPVLHDIPVVMLTMLDDKSKGFALGAADYLTKPIDRDRLHTVLSRYHQSDDDARTVLLVEDDADARELTRRVLAKVRWQVVEAGNGQEALDALAQLKPNLILLDLMMPVMDGFEFLQRLRANPDWRDIPVIVVTAKDLDEADQQALSGKVQDVMEKGGYSREQLLARIRELVDAGLAQ